MTSVNLTQAEADALLVMEKHRADSAEWNHPSSHGKVRAPLISKDGREQFFLDLWRSSIDLSKGTYQNRCRHVVILARLDFGSAPHRNPDGQEIGSPHLHLYREGFGDKWAFPVPGDYFSNIDSLWETFEDFMRFCNITRPPFIKRGLFT
ncbi:MAG: hypothetical protein OXE81_03570 [Gammaproteobacteria bacterium]|nr:hypothetical protein [Gammaproteobacteria bacterium]